MLETPTINRNPNESASHESMASAVAHKADDALDAVGSGMKSLADTLRDKGPEQGVLGSATSKTADTLDSAGRYLHDQGVSGMAEDVTNLIRRNPGPALLFGLGLGFLLAYATRRR
jgi:hypothetical protein